MKVLIADDDPVWRRILEALLVKRGYKVQVVTNGAEAWDALQMNDGPNVAILDWIMPELDGIELCRMLRAHERQSYTYIVLLSAKSQHEDFIEGLHAGADDYLTKPIDAEELFARLRAGERVLKLQRELRSANQENELLLSNSPFGIASFDELAQMVRANPAFCKMIGENAEFDGYGFDIAKVAADSRQANEIVEHIQSGVAFDPVEVTWKRRGGSDLIVRILGRPLHQSASRQRYFVVAEDVTETRRLEEQMRHSQRMEAIGRLAGGVAHDINNVLQSIMLPAELLLMSEQRESAKRKLESIIEVANRGASVAQQLLAFSRRQNLQTKIIDVNQALQEMKQMLRQLIREDVSIDYRLSSSPCFVKIDPGQFVQVMINLVVNARDAMPDGGRVLITVDERSGNASTDSSYVAIIVSDTGSGIAPEIRDRIFEPFFTTKEFGKGTGLGLATVYGIVQQCGGCVDVASEPEHGSTFRICLPLNPPKQDVLEQKPVLRGKETVLLTGDSQHETTKDLLLAHGYEVVSVPSAAAVEKLQKMKVELVVAEIGILDSRTHSLAKRLRADLPNVPIILTAAYPETAIDPSLLAPGCAYLQTPVPHEELLLTIRTLLNN